MLTELFIESRGGPPPARLVLDIDCTDDEMHGRQEGRFFHGYYGHYCFLPLYVFCGAHPLCAVLRPGNADPALGVVRQLRRIVGQFRRRWPDVELIVRADSAYAREEIMAFREGERDIHYVLGVARNDRLAGRIAPELLAAKVESKGRGRPVRLYTEFAHSTRTSWSRARRLIAKAEHIPGKRPTPASSSPRSRRRSLREPSTSASTVPGATPRTPSRNSSSTSSPTAPPPPPSPPTSSGSCSQPSPRFS